MVEMAKYVTLRWLEYLEGMGEIEMTRRIYKSGIDDGRMTPCKVEG